MHYLLEKFDGILKNYHIMDYNLEMIDNNNYQLTITSIPVELDAKFVALKFNGEDVFIPFKDENKNLCLKCYLNISDYAGKINEIDAAIRRYRKK